MARKKKSLVPLGESEMEILQEVWKLDSATVSDVHQILLKQRKVAYTTVMTIMKNLADKGYLKYRKQGVTYVYSPARSADEVKGSLLTGIMDKVFKGSPAALLQTLVKQENLSDEERAEIIDLIKKMEK